MKITDYEIEDVYSWDYPDFCDAYISYAEDENGKEMTEDKIKNGQKTMKKSFMK